MEAQAACALGARRAERVTGRWLAHRTKEMRFKRASYEASSRPSCVARVTASARDEASSLR